MSDISEIIQEEQRKTVLLTMEVDEQNYQNTKEKEEEMQACLV